MTSATENGNIVLNEEFLMEEGFFIQELFRDGKINHSEYMEKKKELSQKWDDFKAGQE